MYRTTNKRSFRGNAVNRLADFFGSQSSLIDLERDYENQRENFRDIIKELPRLKEEENLSDDEFSALISLVCSFYIGNELDRRVGRVLLNKTDMIFDRYVNG